MAKTGFAVTQGSKRYHPFILLLFPSYIAFYMYNIAIAKEMFSESFVPVIVVVGMGEKGCNNSWVK